MLELKIVLDTSNTAIKEIPKLSLTKYGSSEHAPRHETWPFSP